MQPILKKRGLIFNIAVSLLLLMVMTGIIFIFATKENLFRQKAIGENSYRLLNFFYNAEIDRQVISQAGKYALLAAVNMSLEKGLSQACGFVENTALWLDGDKECFPTMKELEVHIEQSFPVFFRGYANAIAGSEYTIFVNATSHGISVIALPKGSLLYEAGKPQPTNAPPIIKPEPLPTRMPPESGLPWLPPQETETAKSPDKISGACPTRQRPLPNKYFAAFSTYEGAIYKAAASYSVDPALLAAIITKETSFGTNPAADRTDEYGKPFRDGIPDYLAGCRVCFIAGCLSHPTSPNPSRAAWTAPPNSPSHNIMCAAERLAAYREKLHHGESFGCLRDPHYYGSDEATLIRKLACTYNSGPEKFAYAEEVYAFYLQWKYKLCEKNELTSAVVAEQTSKQRLRYFASPFFSAEIIFNNTALFNRVKEIKEQALSCKKADASPICFRKLSLAGPQCQGKPALKDGAADATILACTPFPAPTIHGTNFSMQFAFRVKKQP